MLSSAGSIAPACHRTTVMTRRFGAIQKAPSAGLVDLAAVRANRIAVSEVAEW